MILRAAATVSLLLMLVISVAIDIAAPGGQALAQSYPVSSVQRSPANPMTNRRPSSINAKDDPDELGPSPFPGLPAVPYLPPAIPNVPASAYAYGASPAQGGLAPPNTRNADADPPVPADPNGSSHARVAAPPAQNNNAIRPLSPPARTVVAAPKRGSLPEQLRRTVVDIETQEPPGTIIIDTPNTYLYLVLGQGRAMRYGIGVGREGFAWSGTERIMRMAEWPDWRPPPEMIDRQPYLPRLVAGGEGSPLGARVLYLGKTEYHIHGTNQPSSIGTFGSSGCIRMTNEDVTDLYGRVQLGTRVIVLPAAFE